MNDKITATLTVDTSTGQVQINSFVSETQNLFSQLETEGSSNWANMMSNIVDSVKNGETALSQLGKCGSTAANDIGKQLLQANDIVKDFAWAFISSSDQIINILGSGQINSIVHGMGASMASSMAMAQDNALSLSITLGEDLQESARETYEVLDSHGKIASQGFRDASESADKYALNLDKGVGGSAKKATGSMKTMNIAVKSTSSSTASASAGMTALATGSTAAGASMTGLSGGAGAAAAGVGALNMVMNAMVWIGIISAVVSLAKALWDVFTAADENQKKMKEYAKEVKAARQEIEGSAIAKEHLISKFQSLIAAQDGSNDKQIELRNHIMKLKDEFPGLSKLLDDYKNNLDVLPEAMNLAKFKNKWNDFSRTQHDALENIKKEFSEAGEDYHKILAEFIKNPGDIDNILANYSVEEKLGKRVAASAKEYSKAGHNMKETTRDITEAENELIEAVKKRLEYLGDGNVNVNAKNMDRYSDALKNAKANYQLLLSQKVPKEKLEGIRGIIDNLSGSIDTFREKSRKPVVVSAEVETSDEGLQKVNLLGKLWKGVTGFIKNAAEETRKIKELNKMEKDAYFLKYGTDAEKTSVILETKLGPALRKVQDDFEKLDGNQGTLDNSRFEAFSDVIKDIDPDLQQYISKVDDVGKFMARIDGETPADQLAQFRKGLEEIRDVEIKNDFLLKFGNEAEKTGVLIATELVPAFEEAEKNVVKFGTSAEALDNARFESLTKVTEELFPDLKKHIDAIDDKKDFLKDIDFSNPAKALQQFIDKLKKLQEQEDARTLEDQFNDLSDSTREMANIMGQASMIADAFGASWAGALAQVADGLLQVSDGFAQMASGDYMAAAASFAQGISNAYSATLGRDGAFGSGQYDDAHVDGWARSIGLNDPQVIEQTKQRTSDLRDQGYDKFEARKIAEMEAIPAAIEALGKLDSAQVDKMFWSIAHGMEEMGGGFGAWKAALPSIIPLLDQIDGGSVKMTDHVASLVSGLMRQGLATEEVLEKATRFASDDDLRAWMSETANGAANGTIKLQDFSRQFSALIDAADSKGVYVEGQIEQMVSAAASMGWTLDDITTSIQDSIDATQQNIDNINGQLESAFQTLDDAKAARWDYNHYRKQENEDKFKDHLAANKKTFKFTRDEDIAYNKVKRGKDGKILRDDDENPLTVARTLEAGEYSGQRAFNQINKQVEALTGGKRAMSFKEMQEMVKGVDGKDNKEALMEYLKGQNEGLKIQEQIENAKKQVEHLKEQRRIQKGILNQHNARLDRIKNVLDKIKENTNATGKYAGGLMESRRYYEIAERGPEYIMSNNALNRYGLEFMESINNGSYSPAETPVFAPVVGSNNGNFKVTASVNGNNQIVINSEVNGQQGDPISFDIVRDKILPLIDKAREAGY